MIMHLQESVSGEVLGKIRFFEKIWDKTNLLVNAM